MRAVARPQRLWGAKIWEGGRPPGVSPGFRLGPAWDIQVVFQATIQAICLGT